MELEKYNIYYPLQAVFGLYKGIYRAGYIFFLVYKGTSNHG